VLKYGVMNVKTEEEESARHEKERSGWLLGGGGA
jgi:hypothetical protein